MSELTPLQTQEDPPCPRVNTWAVGYPPGPFLTTAQTVTLTQPKDAVESGIDIFFWKYKPPILTTENGVETFEPGRKGQVCEFFATGDYVFEESDAGEDLDQTKYSIRYSQPGRYSVTVRVYNVDP